METLYTGIKPDLSLDHQKEFDEIKRRYIGKRTKITIEESSKRSVSQNDLIWFYCEQAGKELGYTKDELYYTMECEINGYTEKEMNGKLYRIPKQKFKEMSKMDAMWYIGEFQRIIAEQGITLPDVKDYYDSLEE